MGDTGIVKIHNKEYKTVALRVKEFREEYEGHGIETDVISQADLVTVKATITNSEGRIVASGYAEENRAFGQINKTSALENAETSAVGRALAFLGLGGTEIASADEVAGAIGQQNVAKVMEPLLAHNTAVRDNLAAIMVIQGSIANEEYSSGAEAWVELGEDVQRALWIAISKGGVFTTEERRVIKTPQFYNANGEAE